MPLLTCSQMSDVFYLSVMLEAHECLSDGRVLSGMALKAAGLKG